MGKLIRNGIEYGGGNGTDIYEVTQSQYNTLKQAGTLVRNALYVITDAENLNCTADDIEFSSGVTVKQKIDSKQDKAWAYVGGLYDNSPSLDISAYNEIAVILETGVSGTPIRIFNGLFFKAYWDLYSTVRLAYYGSASYNVSGDLTYNNGSLTYAQFSLNGWTINNVRVFGR